MPAFAHCSEIRITSACYWGESFTPTLPPILEYWLLPSRSKIQRRNKHIHFLKGHCLFTQVTIVIVTVYNVSSENPMKLQFRTGTEKLRWLLDENSQFPICPSHSSDSFWPTTNQFTTYIGSAVCGNVDPVCSTVSNRNWRHVIHTTQFGSGSKSNCGPI